MNSRFVQWVTTCSAAIRWFVLWDNVLLESKKELLKEPPEPTQRELVVKASRWFSKTVDVGQFLRTRSLCDAHGRSTEPDCKKQTKTFRRIQDIRLSFVFVETEVVARAHQC